MRTYVIGVTKYALAALAGALFCYVALPKFSASQSSAIVVATPSPKISIETENLGDSARSIACAERYQNLVDAKFVEYAMRFQQMGLPPFSSFYPIEKFGTAEAEGFISIESCKPIAGDGIIQDGGVSCGFTCNMWGESNSFSMELWVQDNKDKEVELLEMSFNHGA